MNHENKTINIYLAGPMSGREDYNYQAFLETAENINAIARNRGKNVHVVHTANAPREMDYGIYLGISYFFLAKSDAIVFMEGWEKSMGSNWERERAMELGVPEFFIRNGSCKELLS